MNKLIKEQFIKHIETLQNSICDAIEKIDKQAVFIQDKWKREEGGGGDTRVIMNGNVFEKGGVNTSVVHGRLSQAASRQLKADADYFFACGLSLVIHPVNPFVPTVHANWRYFELQDESGKILDAWFGGGTDLTPYYLFEEDVMHFHSTQKQQCDDFDLTLYPIFKQQCDDYFSNHHRKGERRGVGGIFFDHCRGTTNRPIEFWNAFTEGNGLIFLEGYLPIVKKRKDIPFNDKNKFWQEIRRGRYVEFNLLHDRGTLFGIKTGGRTESILMSLPPRVRFEYNYQPEKGSEEEKLIKILMHPKDWLKVNVLK